MRYIKLSEYAKNQGVTYKTAWNRFKKDKIPGAYMDPNHHHILVPVSPADKLAPPNHVCIYARVSSSENKDNLESQVERLKAYAVAKGYTITKIVKEVGSGVNDKRLKLQDALVDDTWGTLVVEHKDRLTRFGFNYLDVLLEKLGKKIDVVNLAENDKTGLMEDLIAIVYSFSARMYGLRRAKRKTEEITRCLNENCQESPTS